MKRMLTQSTRSLHRGAIWRQILVLTFVALLALAAKGSGPFKEGQKAELAGDWDRAVVLYEMAVKQDPRNSQYLASLRRTKFVAAMRHVDTGHKLRDQNKLDEALEEFQKAVLLDPAAAVTEQEVSRTRSMIEARKKAPGEEVLTPQQLRLRNYEQKMSQAESPAELMPISRKPINMHMTNESKIIFETIGKLAGSPGINVLTDPDYQSKRITVDLVNTTLEQALDYAGLLSKTLWTPISGNTIIIYQDSKRRDHDPLVLKTIYLSNTVQANEITEITQTIRNMLDNVKLMQVNAQNAIVIRATPDQVAVAEKIINDIDKAKAEVVVDVMVMAVGRDLSRQLGVSPVSNGNPGIQIPVSFSPLGGVVGSTGTTGGTTGTTGGTTGSTNGTSVSLRRAGQIHLDDYSTILPGATINALMSDAHSRILQNPQIRASDGQTAKLRVGQRVPIATGTFSTGIVATGGLPAAQTSFQYTDVGVIMEITPRVNAGREVSMKVVIEISAVDSYQNIGGVNQPVIGQRRIEQDIRLKENEVNVLGGIIQDQQTVTKAGIPLLGQIPVLGHFFSTDIKTVSQSEVLVVLTPRIVRIPDLTELNLRAIDTGSAAALQLRYKQTLTAADGVAGAPWPVASPLAPAPTAAVAGPTGLATPATSPAILPGTGTNPITPEPAASLPPTSLPGQTALRFSESGTSASVGMNFTLSLEITGATDINSVPLQLRFDPKLLKLVTVAAGDFLTRDGQNALLAPTIDAAAGTATVAITRPATAPGLSGGGKLLVLNFQGLAPGTAKVEVVGGSARSPVREPRPLPPAETTVTVK